MLKTMSRFARVAALACLGLLCVAQVAQAQRCAGGGFGAGCAFGGRGFGRGFGGGFGGIPFLFGPGYGGYGGYGGYPGSYFYPGAFGYPAYLGPGYTSSTDIYQPITVFVTANITPMVGPPEDDRVEVPNKPATIEVVVPAKATLLVNGKPTQQTGTRRQFATPPMPANAVYTCELRATWTDASGAEVILTQTVRVGADQRAVVNFVEGGEQGGAEAAAAAESPERS